jgi:hypothetical protein
MLLSGSRQVAVQARNALCYASPPNDIFCSGLVGFIFPAGLGPHRGLKMRLPIQSVVAKKSNELAV